MCELPVPFSGSGASVAANIEIEPVTRKAGPESLEAIVVGNDVSLNWPILSYAFAYALYRGINPEGPFELLTSNLQLNSFVDAGLVPGTYYFKVTGIEPDFGETFPSPVVSATV